MALHVDIPSRAQLERLLNHRSPASISLYVAAGRMPDEGNAARIAVKSLGSQALDQVRAAGGDHRLLVELEGFLDDLDEHDGFWTYQAESLAVFLSPAGIQTFRLANHLTPLVEVSGRFHVKPLLRAVTFPQEGLVLALAQGSVRLLEFGPAGPAEDINVPDLPRDAWDPRSNKVVMAREGTYVRRIDQALRPVLQGIEIPLFLASTETIAAAYRTVNSYPYLADTREAGNPEKSSDAELVTAARALLDEIYAQELVALRDLFAERSSQGRTATDISDVARLATFGAVETLMVDIDQTVPGTIDESSGAVTFDAESTTSNYGVLDEAARRVLLMGGAVKALRREDIPGGGPVAALLRFMI